MSATCEFAVNATRLGLLRVAPLGLEFPGRQGGPQSPAIIDVRGAAANLPLRTLVVSRLATAVLDYPFDAVIAGVSRGGLVLGAMLALLTGRPFVAVLPEGPRASGLKRAVEGDVSGQKVVLFDNVLTTGGSLRDAANQILAAGGQVVGAMVVARYGSLPQLRFPVSSLTSLAELVIAAHELGNLTDAQRNEILKKIAP